MPATSCIPILLKTADDIVNQYLIFGWITREVVGFMPGTSCIPILLKTADDIVNLLTQNIYLLVVSISTQLNLMFS